MHFSGGGGEDNKYNGQKSLVMITRGRKLITPRTDRRYAKANPSHLESHLSLYIYILVELSEKCPTFLSYKEV